MPTRFREIVYSLSWITLAVLSPAKAEDSSSIQPPFDLRFGQYSTEVREMLDKANARITSTAMVDGNPTWTVDGIRQAGLERAVFTFRQDELAAVELQYHNHEWTSERYRSFMARVKQNIESKYGEGATIARKQSEDEGVRQTVMGYEWRRGQAMIQLFYFSATSPDDAFYTVSIHYKAL